MMIGMVTNMMEAACNTSGVLVTAAASESVVVWASVADATIWYNLYCTIFKESDLI